MMFLRRLTAILLMPPTALLANDLAKQSQNPVANMVSVPFENNADFDVGPSGERMYTTVIKPVYPVSVTENINLINRFVAPVIYMEGQDVPTPPDFPVDLPGGGRVFPGDDDEFGLGNLQYQAFFSPAAPDDWCALASSRWISS